MPRNPARERVSTLWQTLAVERGIEISFARGRENEVSDNELMAHNIVRMDLDLSLLDDRAVNLEHQPPILFWPLPIDTLVANPIDPSSYGHPEDQLGIMFFRDYEPDSIDEVGVALQTNPGKRAEMVQRYVQGWACDFPRPGLGPSGQREALSHLRCVRLPNPLWLWGSWGSHDPDHGGYWHGRDILECLREDSPGIYPHVTLSLIQPFNGREGCMLFSELYIVLSAMHRRANQPRVDPEDIEAQSALHSGNLNSYQKMRKEFAVEKRFPVLLLSYMGSQHARIIYACMDGQKLVIQQSRLYSFERKDSAPFDLFARILLSRPLTEEN